MPPSPVVEVDEAKCRSCRRCVAACPVKYCQDCSGDAIRVDARRCIGCGACVEACPHGARQYRDDWAAFAALAEAGAPTVAMVAPAVAASFAGKIPRLNGFLSSLGVAAFFDVSFGAELAVRSYLEYAKAADPDLLIAQPCPAIVNYVQLYRPELRASLAPVHSPMLHTYRMIREFHPEYAAHRVVAISPCIAKRLEFDGTEPGILNIAFRSIEAELDRLGRSLEDYPELGFSSPPAERATLFSTPGGFGSSLFRDAPELAGRTRRIEGPGIVYHYLDSLVELGKLPAKRIVDCLSCERGCNGGPGTSNSSAPLDLIEGAVAKRAEEARIAIARRSEGDGEGEGIGDAVARFWKPGLYERSYEDRSGAIALSTPTPDELGSIYRRMRKDAPEDILDCLSCGYNSCEGMALAIHNGLDRPENCQLFKIRELEKSILNDVELRQSIEADAYFADADFADRLDANGPPLGRERIHRNLNEAGSRFSKSS